MAQTASQIEKIAQQANANLPRSETDTIVKVILKLLSFAGYTEYDVVFEETNQAGRPDIVFSGKPQCESWWLEAKKWKTALDASHIVQLLNYVNSQGGRWGILTNGYEWRLYDNSLPGPPPDRLVVSATLDESYEMALFVEAISKDSSCTGQVAARAKQLKVYQDMRQLLTNPDGHPLKQTLAKHYGVSDMEIADIIKRVVQNHISPATTQASQAGASTNSASPAQQSAPTAAVPQGASASSAASNSISSQPKFPCPEQPILYSSWKKFYVDVVEWCYSQDPNKTVAILRSMGHYYEQEQRTPATNFLATHPLPNKAGHFRTHLSSSSIQACVERFAQDFPQLEGCTVQIKRQQKAGKSYEPWTIPPSKATGRDRV